VQGTDFFMPTKHSKNLKNNAANNLEYGKIQTPTWIDPKTTLEWQCESAGEMSWNEALEYAQSLSLNGKDDWRIPSVAELETLLDRSILYDKLRPIMREEVPFRDTLSYWSSTTFAPNTYSAWIVMFDGGYVLSYYKSTSYYVRCVRG
jgi:formylglycine-generating enzyme required for sulfatase activity